MAAVPVAAVGGGLAKMPRRARSVPPALLGRGSSSFSDTISEASFAAAGDNGLGLEGALKVVGRRCMLFDRPGRADIRRVAVWDTGLREHSLNGSRFASGRTASRAHRLLACGLSEHEVFDLLYRDITPEDYDMLLRLDELVPKKTASAEAVDGLRKISAGERRHETCGVCLMPFEDGDYEDGVLTVPCPAAHEFHRACISRWLTEYKNTCPVDHAELW